jgi:hypothetical protein
MKFQEPVINDLALACVSNIELTAWSVYSEKILSKKRHSDEGDMKKKKIFNNMSSYASYIN